MESFGIFTVYKTGTKRRKVNKIDFINLFGCSGKRKKKFWTVLQFLNRNRLGLAKFRTIIPVFHEGKS